MPAVEGFDYVVHAAAHVGDWGPADKYRQRNVFALEHMLTAARSYGRLRCWIQISSMGIYPARPHHGTDETLAPDLSGLDGYTRTKAEAEVLLQRHMDEFSLPAVILRPGFVYGPGDRHVLPRIIEKLRAGKMKMIGDGQKKLNNTSVHNLADAVVLALEKPAVIGETFNIRDERLVTRQEFVSTITEAMGVPYPGKVAEPVARALVVIVEGLAKLRGATSAPFITRARVKFLAQNLDFSIEKAKRLLAYEPRVDFQEGMRETLEWARSIGLMPDNREPTAATN
jgi:nucleoside-diphosphate-sugar epimerase